MKPLVILLIVLLLFPTVASAKIIGNFSTFTTPVKTVSLAEAKVNETNTSETNNISVVTPTPVIHDNNAAMSAGAKMVSMGIQAFFGSIADGIFNIGGSANESTSVKNDYGYAVGSVFKIATYSNDPYQSKTVQAMRTQTAIIGVFIFVLYVFYGAACVNLSCGGGGFFERAQYMLIETPFSEYKNTLIRTFGAIFLVLLQKIWLFYKTSEKHH